MSNLTVFLPCVDDSEITVNASLTEAVVAFVPGQLPFVLGAFREADDAHSFMEGLELGIIESPDYELGQGGYLRVMTIKEARS